MNVDVFGGRPGAGFEPATRAPQASGFVPRLTRLPLRVRDPGVPGHLIVEVVR